VVSAGFCRGLTQNDRRNLTTITDHRRKARFEPHILRHPYPSTLPACTPRHVSGAASPCSVGSNGQFLHDDVAKTGNRRSRVGLVRRKGGNWQPFPRCIAFATAVPPGDRIAHSDAAARITLAIVAARSRPIGLGGSVTAKERGKVLGKGFIERAPNCAVRDHDAADGPIRSRNAVRIL